jgi:hypothetical protein
MAASVLIRIFSRNLLIELMKADEEEDESEDESEDDRRRFNRRISVFLAGVPTDECD